MLKLLNKRNSRIALAFIVLVLFSIIPPLSMLLVGKSQAAGTMSNAKVQINNSQASASSVTYSMYFTTSVTTAIKQIGIQFCDAASGTCNVPTGFSPGSPTLSSDNIAGTGRTTTDPNTSGERMRIVVTTPSSQATQPMFLNFTGITNPSTANTTSFVRITTYSDTGSTAIDSVVVAFAVLDTTSIAVSATVDPVFTFAVALVGSAQPVNGATTTVGSTQTTIPFGTLVAATPAIAAHDLTVTTNAVNGYQITASTSANSQSGNPPLISGNTNNIDSFSGPNSLPTTWSSPGGGTANTNTGFFGYTTNSTTLCGTGGASRFSSNLWAGAALTAGEVACSSTGISAQITRVGWQIEVNSIQPAGSYTGTVNLIATPTY